MTARDVALDQHIEDSAYPHPAPMVLACSAPGDFFRIVAREWDSTPRIMVVVPGRPIAWQSGGFLAREVAPSYRSDLWHIMREDGADPIWRRWSTAPPR